MWKHKNFINLQLYAGPIPYEVIVNGTTFYIQRLSDSGLTGENTWSYNASINTDTYSISGNTVVWNDGTILQYNGVDVLPTDDIIGIVGNPGIYTTRSATPQPTLTFKHFFDAGTIGSGTVKFRHYSQRAQLATPQNVAASGTIVSWDAVENATSYEVLVNNSSFGTVSTTSVDLSTLSGWASLTDGTYSVTIVAKADGYRDSEPSAAVSITKQGGGGTVTPKLTKGTWRWITPYDMGYERLKDCENNTTVTEFTSGGKTFTGFEYDAETGRVAYSSDTEYVDVIVPVDNYVNETYKDIIVTQDFDLEEYDFLYTAIEMELLTKLS